MINVLDSEDALEIEGGGGLHSQESGDAGFSSNMKHNFADLYTECSLPVEDKGSFVIPIPKEESDNYEAPAANAMRRRPGSCNTSALAGQDVTSVRGYANPELYPESVGWGFFKPATPALPPEDAMICLSPGEETVLETIPGTAAIPDDPDDAEETVESAGTDMDYEGKAAKPAGPQKACGEERRRKRHSKRASWRHIRKYFLLAVTFILVPVVAADCFRCMDKERCQNVLNIFDDTNAKLYKRDADETLAACSETSQPETRKTCEVCRIQSQVFIGCSDDVTRIEVEDAEQIQNISDVSCDQMKRITEEASDVQQVCGCARHAWISVSVVFLILFG